MDTKYCEECIEEFTPSEDDQVLCDDCLEDLEDNSLERADLFAPDPCPECGRNECNDPDCIEDVDFRSLRTTLRDQLKR